MRLLVFFDMEVEAVLLEDLHGRLLNHCVEGLVDVTLLTREYPELLGVNEVLELGQILQELLKEIPALLYK